MSPRRLHEIHVHRIDFMLRRKLTSMGFCRGTLPFCSPEVCRRLYGLGDDVLTGQLDIWSLGITLAHLWLGDSPWIRLKYEGPEPSLDSLLFEIALQLAEMQEIPFATGAHPCWDALDMGHDIVTKLVRACCHPRPECRLTAGELCSMLQNHLEAVEHALATQVPQLHDQPSL